MNQPSGEQQPPSNKIGQYFTWIAWLLALGLLVFFFQDILEQQWNPNSDPEYYLSEQGRAEVHLKQNRQGHYLSNGTINAQAVTFLLDTGATQVSIPKHIAQQLSLPKYGQYPVETANGRVMVTQTKITQLSIGNIFLEDVSAHINPGMRSDEILLGMSALRRVEFRQTGNRLILRER